MLYGQTLFNFSTIRAPFSLSLLGKNILIPLIFVQTIEALEKEMLNGQKLQGPATALEVNVQLKAKNMEQK